MSAPHTSPRVVVVGGGVTGLTAAYRLRGSGIEAIVLERDDRLGGRILTERRDGFVLEAGPDGFLAAKAAGRELCEELGLALVASSDARARASVLWDGRLHLLPDGLRGVVPTRIRPLLTSSLLSPAGKSRLVLAQVRPGRPQDGDESLGIHARRRFGREVWERLVEPLATGVYGGDADALSLRAAFPALATAGGPSLRHPAPGVGGPAFLAPEAGLDALVAALREAIGGERILTGAGASAITRVDRGYRVALDGGGAIAADAVIVAAPAHSAARLVDPLDSALAVELGAIAHASTAVVIAAIPAPIGQLDIGHGFVVPGASGSPVVACSVATEKWPGRAPVGWTVVRTFIGRAGYPDALTLDDEALTGLAREAWRIGLGVDDDPLFTRVIRWPDAMPQYTVGHLDRFARIAARVATHPGLAVAGNFLRGIGIPDCILSGSEAAAVVGRHFAAIRSG